jgi:O-antigen/teichoic acid export membrane protein
LTLEPKRPDDRRMSRLKELLSGKFQQDVMWNFASLAVLGVSGILLKVIIGRYYDAVALGVFNQTLAAWFIFSQIAVAGIDRSTLRAVAEHTNDREEVSAIVAGALVATLALSAVVTLAYWGSIGWLSTWFNHSENMPTGLAVSAPGLFFFALNKVLLGVVNGVQRMRAFAVYQTLRYSIPLLGLIGFLVLDVDRKHGNEIPVVFSVEECVLFLVLVLDVRRLVSLSLVRGWREWTREHLHYGIKSVVSGVLLELNAYVDIFVIGHFMTESDVGIYSFAAVLAVGFFQILFVLQNIYNPILAREIAAHRFEELEATIRRGRRWTYAGMAGVGLVAALVYPHALLFLTGKATFLASWAPFNYLVLGTVLASGYIPFAQTLLMSGHPGWHTGYMVATVAINAIACWFAVPQFGLVGAAISTASSMFASVFILKAMVRWRVGLKL